MSTGVSLLPMGLGRTTVADVSALFEEAAACNPGSLMTGPVMGQGYVRPLV